MSAALRIAAVGPGASIQDRGRFGHARWGVSPAGPMDWARHALALALAGEAPGAPAFEIGLGGLVVEAEGAPVALGLAGPGFRAALDGEPLEPPVAFALRPGARLEVRAGARGAWAYLAALGLDAGPPVLGSRAASARAGLGPPPPEAGARYPCAAVEQAGPPRPFADAVEGQGGPIRLLPGPQRHLFGEDALTAGPYRVSPKGDRMGIWLDGPPLRAAGGHDIASDGVVEGAIQVPGSGAPVALMADRQPTGGYPKPAVVIRADLPRLAQMRPGEEIRFAFVSPEEARAARRALEAALAAPEPRARGRLATGLLLTENLVGGVWGG